MRNTYRLDIQCVCPVDGLADIYAVTVVASRTIPVEDILSAVKEVTGKPVFQEELCSLLHRKLNAYVAFKGTHSGVEVTSECGLL